mgnify:CR=1 FL=1
MDLLLLYLNLKENELYDMINNQSNYDIYSWWDIFNEQMYRFNNTNKTIEEDMKLSYIRNRIELLLHLNFSY